MASIPEHFHSSLDHCYTLFPSDHLSGLPVPTAAAAVGGGGAMWGGQDDFMVPFYGENIGLVDANNNSSSSPTESFMSSSSSLTEQVGISDGVVPAFSDYRSSMMGLHGIVGAQNFGGSYNTSCVNYPQYVNANGFEFGEECSATSFLPELIKPVGLVSAQKNWGMQNNQNIHAIEESNMMKVGRYSEEERKERIVRYLKKRNQRNFNKTIKYACRKTLADRRVRVRGRFARNNELMMCGDQQMESQKINNIDPAFKDIELCCDDTVQIKYDEDEDWLRDFALCCWVNGGAN